MEIQEEFNFSYLFIAHDLSVVKHISDNVGVMYLGKIVERGPKKEIFSNSLHPYTQALLSSVPRITGDNLETCTSIKGEIPSPINLPTGCYFHERCPYTKKECIDIDPQEKEIGVGHFVKCHLY